MQYSKSCERAHLPTNSEVNVNSKDKSTCVMRNRNGAIPYRLFTTVSIGVLILNTTALCISLQICSVFALHMAGCLCWLFVQRITLIRIKSECTVCACGCARHCNIIVATLPYAWVISVNNNIRMCVKSNKLIVPFFFMSTYMLTGCSAFTDAISFLGLPVYLYVVFLQV